ncbi:hypothetical protein GCM10011391_13420 [Pullulanibacillus camelliae]|uniref:DUF2306 domain-containing protein n=2 Tax=Pullulanibacillus camelliae TaxID=1707096 RepID=A0A8J2VL98_9BACL|nr:hypothetical protein GCM10011391_13420 [Pullulanibacillus camelliae]
MKLIKNKVLYVTMIAISVAYIVYVVSANLFFDPQATHFLSHKTSLNHSINVPVWLNVLHIHVIVACLAIVTGTINFLNKIQRKYRKFHRMNGYLYILAVFAVCGTSGYMAPYATGGRINSMAFNLMNIIWILMTITALIQIKRKQVNKHRKWMVRSYAYCFTNLLIKFLTFVLYDVLGMQYDMSYTSAILGTILLNYSLAEIVIRRVYRIPTHLGLSKNIN